MRFVIQRVTEASVAVGNQTIGRIGRGFLVLIGIGQGDDRIIADKMVKKLISLRIFQDEFGKTNLDIRAVEGELLMVSQFTLYADCKKGNRPSFTGAGDPKEAEALYNYIIGACASEIPVVRQGLFGAEMKVSLINDGPFTVILDSAELGAVNAHQ